MPTFSSRNSACINRTLESFNSYCYMYMKVKNKMKMIKNNSTINIVKSNCFKITWNKMQGN